MIDVKAVTARRAGVTLAPTTLALAAGRHALLGRPEDGASLLLACCAGEIKPRRGTLTVLGADARNPKTRARVGWIPLGVTLPDVLRVDETIRVARNLRGDPDVADAAAVALAPFGLEALARRRVDSLDPSEVRAVALAEVLASKSVSVVLLEEPFVSMAAPAALAIPRLFAEKKNTCFVCSTASAEDASLVATDFALFDRGRLVRIVAEAPLRPTREKPRIHIVTENARTLAAALAQHAEVEHLELSPRGVLASGSDVDALASAVNAAIIITEVDVIRMELEPASLESLRADAASPPPTPQPKEAAP